jgi:hypothetical protein
VSTFYGLHSAREVEEAGQKMRDSIAKGELNAESSYVTRWNAETKCVEVVAGKFTEASEEEQEAWRREKVSEEEDERINDEHIGPTADIDTKDGRTQQ